jgi:ketosteroid isomerase-like protein
MLCLGSIRMLVTSILIAALISPATAQTDNTAQAEIRATLARWTADFNAGNAQNVCGLFAPDLIAQFRGQPERDHKGLCDVLMRSLNDRTKTYTYSLAIKEILVAGDFAVVRLVWTLKIQRKDAPGETMSEEPGMDIFRRQPDGSWKISRFIAYDTSP